MFQINHILKKSTDDHYLEVRSQYGDVFASINLSNSASITQLKFGDNEIIGTTGLPYEQSFDSALLFPFPNRIKNNGYNYKGKIFKLKANFSQENIAIHGLVYNRAFELTKTSLSRDEAKLYFKFVEDNPNSGYPFRYGIDLVYTIRHSLLNMEVEIRNLDSQAFPFALGWHPYFSTPNLNESEISLVAELQLDKHGNIARPIKTVETNGSPSKIGDTLLDDCFKLKSNMVLFTTASHSLKLSFDHSSSYLQLYTPETRKHLAIEPMTAPADAFNNGIGLNEIEPGQTFKAFWKVEEMDRIVKDLD